MSDDEQAQSPPISWKEYLADMQKEPGSRKQFRELRQTIKKARSFMARKAVRNLKAAKSRVKSDSPENISEKVSLKHVKSVERFEKTKMLIKALDLDLAAVVAMLKLTGKCDEASAISADQTADLSATITSLLSSSVVNSVMHRLSGKTPRDDDHSHDILSQDESDDSEDQVDDVDVLPRKNRPGQRARQALLAKKFGKSAHHISKPKNSAKRPQITEPVVDEEVHPSWAAAKKRKAESGVKFGGTKITF